MLFLAFGWRLLPHGRRGSASGTNFTIEDYTSEVRAYRKNRRLSAARSARSRSSSGGDIGIVALIRDGGRRQIPTRRWKLYAGDVLVVEADPQALEQFARDGNLELVGSEKPPEKAPQEGAGARRAGCARARRRAKPGRELEAPSPSGRHPTSATLSIVEAVITAGSDLIGRSAATLHLRERYGVNVLAIGRRGQLRSTRLRQTRFKLGDAIVLQGHTGQLPDILVALGCLPLAERHAQPRAAAADCSCRWRSSPWRSCLAASSWSRRRSPLSAPRWRWCCSAW